jgi:hypothetical protein
MSTTLGLKLRDNLHLIRTGWLDINGAGPQYATFDPTQDLPALRYGCPVRQGNPSVSAIRGYLASNDGGSHASGLHSQAYSLVYQVFPDVTPTVHDLEDINMVNGAAEAIVQRAIQMNLIDAQGNTPRLPGEGGSSGSGGGTVDPCADLKTSLALAQAEIARLNTFSAQDKEALKAAVTSIGRVTMAAAKARHAMPNKGGGIYRQILVTLLDTLDAL